MILAAAVAASIVPMLLAQTQQNPPTSATSPAGAGGLNPGRGRGPAVPTGPAPKLANGHPDFSGVWQGGGPVGDLAQGMPKGEAVPLSEEGKRVMASRRNSADITAFWTFQWLLIPARANLRCC